MSGRVFPGGPAVGASASIGSGFGSLVQAALVTPRPLRGFRTFPPTRDPRSDARLDAAADRSCLFEKQLASLQGARLRPGLRVMQHAAAAARWSSDMTQLALGMYVAECY